MVIRHGISAHLCALRQALFLGSCALVLGLTAAAQGQQQRTALDDYVAKADDSFSWTVAATHKEDGYTHFVLDLKSQSWRSPDEVSRTQWEHWVTIVKPDRVTAKNAMLFIGGGGKKTDPPSKPSDIAKTLALGTGSIVAELSMVPNQPLVFHKDGKERVEDDLIAYTWMQLMKTGDPTWTARMPMVKSAVRAMDAVQAFMKSDAGGNLPVDGFVVAGGSKRGWTTWLTGAVDKRVVAIVPIVIDVLNVRRSMDHHHHAYGFWAPSVGDYVRHKIFEMKDSAAYAALLKLEDPYSYIDRLTMPKFIVNAAGDEFFLPDSSQFYFNELKGEKYLRYVPNANHSLRGSDALESVMAFYNAILTNKPRPQFSWTFEGEDTIRVKTKEKPVAVNLWQATNPKARDFRLETLGPEYRSHTLAASADGDYVARVERPGQGWTAYFVELTFDSGFKIPFKFTTAVRVTPDTLPFADKPTTGGE
ncbi:MAG TPA: PhoPQ-activated pathogenicity-related family protein [Pirellulales bacterium]|nr:PhoPQ-activated pathogenicity-related family protein [Pirellulales bacterium]